MSRRELAAWLAAVAAAIAVSCILGYVAVRNQQIRADAAINQEQIKQQHATKRTEERWGTLPWNRKKQTQ